MLYLFLSDLVVIIHLAFIVFAVFGGFLLLKWKRLVWLHVPTILWAAVVEIAGWVCPLTPLENWLRELGGGNPYHIDFVEHYLLPFLYPARLTRNQQIILGLLVVLVNLAIYSWLWWRGRHQRAV